MPLIIALKIKGIVLTNHYKKVLKKNFIKNSFKKLAILLILLLISNIFLVVGSAGNNPCNILVLFHLV